MRKIVLIVLGLAVLGSGAWYFASNGSGAAEPAAAEGGGTGRAGGAAGGGGGRAGGRGRGASTLTVETAAATRRDIADYITVVGNLIGQATVDVTPRTAGRIESIPVKLGDRVSRGQEIVKVEDREIREQVNQSSANIEVNKANVVARENDVKVAQSALERARTSFKSGLISAQALEDSDARYNSAISQLNVAKAQLASTQARLDELRITLSNASVVSPVDGFVGKRNLDPGAFAGANTVVLSVVDISTVRLVANLVEKDFKRVERGAEAVVEVDAFPGEQFRGQVSRVAPVFDPATRTATMEIEVANPGFRLKPGMYARVRLLAERHQEALTVPRAAIVDIEGRRGVFLAEGETAKFQQIQSGVSDGDFVEVLSGLNDGARVVTTGSLGLRDGDRINIASADGRGGRGGGRAGGGEGRTGGGREAGAAEGTGAGAAAGAPAAAPAAGTSAAPAAGTGDAAAGQAPREGGRRGGRRSGGEGANAGGRSQQ